MTYWQRLLGLSFEQTYVRALDVLTRVVHAGKGPALVFLHGIAGTLEAHLNLMPRLSERYRVVLYDMPGRGWSSYPDRPYTVEYLAEHLRALVEDLGLDRPILVGQSLGGWVAAWAAAHHSNLTRGVVLNNPGNVKSRPEALERLWASNQRLAENPTREEIRDRMRWLFHRKELLSDEDVEIRYLAYTRPGFARAMKNITAMLVPEIRHRYVWSPDWVGRIRVPVLLIWSAGNPLALKEDMEELCSWFPKGQLLVFESSAEFPQVEEEDRFVGVLESFVVRCWYAGTHEVTP
jgi:2-hydroxy-6-oxonona-2,4-dienedioate hydrolase